MEPPWPGYITPNVCLLAWTAKLRVYRSRGCGLEVVCELHTSCRNSKNVVSKTKEAMILHVPVLKRAY